MMNLAALFLNNMKQETTMWHFVGHFNDSEKRQFDELMSQYEPATKPGGGWNYWMIHNYGVAGIFHLTRFTWDNGWHGSLDEIKAKMKSYQDGE